MTTSNITSSSDNNTDNNNRRRARHYFFKGLFLETLAFILLWFLIDIRSSTQHTMILLASFALSSFSLLAVFQFNAIPNKSVPPEKLTGIIAGVSGFIAGLIIFFVSLLRFI